MNVNLNKLELIRVFSFVLVLSAVSSLSAMAQSKIPDGSYKKTCRNFHVIGGMLTANCENEKGQWVNTKINMDYCEGDIRNENGALKCKQKPAPKPPAGSYKNSCRNIKVQGKQLKASCENRNGKWKQTSINYKKCDRDIWNDNGELSCSKKGGKLPKGSYRDSCRDSYTEGNRLYSKCENRNGKWKNTSINYKRCDKNISNDNGQLVCGKAGGGGKLPPGSYKDSCKNIYKEGNVLEADCKNKNGKWKHSSIRFKECKKGLWNDNGKLRCN